MKQNSPYLLFGLLALLALQSCLSSNDPEPDEPRYVRWGLKLQIGNYVLDSIFPPLKSTLNGQYFQVSMKDICTVEPGCDTVPRTGHIYGWDSECFSHVEMNSAIMGGGAVPTDTATGAFDFSDLNISLQGGVVYSVSVPSKGYDCISHPDYPYSIKVFFSLFDY